MIIHFKIILRYHVSLEMIQVYRPSMFKVVMNGEQRDKIVPKTITLTVTLQQHIQADQANVLVAM